MRAGVIQISKREESRKHRSFKPSFESHKFSFWFRCNIYDSNIKHRICMSFSLQVQIISSRNAFKFVGHFFLRKVDISIRVKLVVFNEEWYFFSNEILRHRQFYVPRTKNWIHLILCYFNYYYSEIVHDGTVFEKKLVKRTDFVNGVNGIKSTSTIQYYTCEQPQ